MSDRRTLHQKNHWTESLRAREEQPNNPVDKALAMKPKSDDREMAPEHLSEQQTPQGSKSCTQESGSILAAGRKSPTVTLRIKGPTRRALFPYPRDA